MDELENAMTNNDMNQIEATVEAFYNQFPGSKNSNFINKTLEAFMKASRLDRAKSFYISAVSNGFKPDERTMVVLLDGYLHHSDLFNAQNLMKSLESFNIQPSIKLMNLWMSYYLKAQQLEKARSIFQQLESYKLQPNATTYSNFIKFFLRNSDFATADRLKKFMRNQKVKVDVQFYNGIIKILFQKHSLAEIDHTLLEMKYDGLKPDAETFHVLIEGYAAMGMLDKAKELIAEMPKYGFKPTIMTFNRLLSSQAYSLNVEQTQEILHQINELGLTFNGYTYVALFKGLLAKQKYEEAVQMLFKMEDSQVYLPAQEFSNLVKICCEHNLDAAVYLFRTQLIKKNLAPSSHVYTSLIKYYLKHRNYKQVDGLLLEMQRKNNMKPSLYILCTLLNHFVEHLDLERIAATLNHLKTLKLEINRVVYNVVMKAFYVHCKCLDGGLVYRADLQVTDDKQGKLLEPLGRRTTVAKIKAAFEETFKIPFKPTVHVFNELMNHFMSSGKYIESLECYEEILKCDLKPNLNTMTLFIKARLYLGQVAEAQRVISEMPKFDLKPTIVQCALVHHSLCRHMMTDEAEIFLQEIHGTHHVKLNYVFFASLVYAYSRNREHVKVFRTFSRLESLGFVPDTETCNYILISLYEVGQYSQAHDMFMRMIRQGIKRNRYTYAIMSNEYNIRNDASRVLSYLDDSNLPGNSIDSMPFNRLLSYFYGQSNMARLTEVIAKQIEVSARFNWESMEYIRYVFYRALDVPETISFARQLLEKTMIDLEIGDSIISQMVESLKYTYQSLADTEGLASWAQFEARLPELRQAITQISPELRGSIAGGEVRNIFGRLLTEPKPSASFDSERPTDAEITDQLKHELDVLSGKMIMNETNGDDSQVNESEMDKFVTTFLQRNPAERQNAARF